MTKTADSENVEPVVDQSEITIGHGKLDTIFTDAAWKEMPTNLLMKKGFFPNRVRRNGDIAVVISNQSKTGSDFPLNAKALREAAAAVKAGQLKEAHVAFVRDKVVLGQVAVDVMEERLRTIEPIAGGKFGDYWWIGEAMIGASQDGDWAF